MIAAVNLMPWREKRRCRQKKRFFITLAAVFALQTGGVVGIEYLVMLHVTRISQAEIIQRTSSRMLHEHEVRRQALIQETEQLTQRWLTLRQQQRDTERWRDFWLMLGTLLPDDLWFTMLEKRPGQVLFRGVSGSVKAIHLFGRTLSEQSLFNRLRQGAITRLDNGTYRFELTAFTGESNDDG